MDDWQKKLKELNLWWQTPAGQKLFVAESHHLAELMRQNAGKNIALIADKHFAGLSNIQDINSCVRLDPFEQDVTGLVTNLDMIIIPHILAYEPNLAVWLKTFYAQLADNGKLIVLGFNYSSLFGLQSLLSHRANKGLPAEHNNLSTIKRELVRYDFAIDNTKKFSPGWLRKSAQSVASNKCSAFGNIYALTASKHLATEKSFEKPWDATDNLISSGLSQPTQRSHIDAS